METTISFGYWIRRQRKALDLTQHALADRVGCSVAAIKKIESDERRPSRQIAERLADILGVAANQREIFLEVARGVRPIDQLLLAHEPAVPSLPSGTVTFLFTDIESSTKLAQHYREVWEALRKRHHAILRKAIEAHNGYIFQIIGDEFCAAFHTAEDAVYAAVKSQNDLHAENWGDAPIRARMGIHTGKAEVQEDGLYHGYVTLSYVQRLMSAGHGGQVLLSSTTQELIQDELPEGLELSNKGQRRLKDFSHLEYIFQLVIPGLPADFPPLSTPELYPHNLPIQLTSFIGRERELAEVKQLLSVRRLLTLTGAGGSGKTRLAIRVATDLLDSFKDGVRWVELASLTDEALVPQAVAKAVGMRELPNQPLTEILTNFLRVKQLLLVLDNCEHLITGCAQLAKQLLTACPELKILATSREALSLAGESTWYIATLSVPVSQNKISIESLLEYEAIHLFVERAVAVKSDFAFTNQNALFVAQVCQQLDGIPLAIELAAARIKVLAVDEIASRLDDRFSLLTGGSRTALPRHQTLRATMDWSYDLLTEPERVLFRRLSAFAGGFTLEAAEAVCSQGLKRSEILDLLGGLVDKSLVIVEADSEIGGTRYRSLETIRQYALEKLIETGEAPVIRDQHLNFFLRLTQEAEPNIFGSQSATWYSRLDKELDNIRAAIEWSTNSGNVVAALQITSSLVFFWFSHGLLASEWHERIQQALSRPEGRERTLARAKALNGIGFMSLQDTYLTDSRPELEEALSIGRELGDKWNTATALRNLGLLENIGGNYLEARSFLEQSLEVWREMGSKGKMGSAWTLAFLGDAALNHDEPERARSLYEESVAILRGLGDLNFLAYAARRLAQLAWREGDFERAIMLCKESLNLNQEVGDPRGVFACLAGFAAIAVAQEQFERAVQLMAAVDTQLSLIGIRLVYVDKVEYDRNLVLLRAKLDKRILNKFWVKGTTMALEQAITFALENESENSQLLKDGLEPSSE